MSQKTPAGESTPKRPSAVNRLSFRTLDAVHGFLYRRGMGRSIGKMQQILLMTTGRKSGKPHTVALGAVREGDGWAVIASYWGADVHPSWWLNLVAHPEATIQVDDQVIKVRMQEITNPADRERIWNLAVSRMKNYARYPKKTSRVIPLGLLRPIA
jgi:deazaflavin-dependent oxidoreductase (nitroreductase family)